MRWAPVLLNRILHVSIAFLRGIDLPDVWLGKCRHTCASESDSEWAGSVDTTSVLWPSAANCTASAAARLVFPTPPFPLTMMYLRPAPADISCSGVDVEASCADATLAACIKGQMSDVL